MSGELKLWVVGQWDGDPEEWSDLGGYSIVLARNADEAKAVSCSAGAATEVCANSPCELALVRVKKL